MEFFADRLDEQDEIRFSVKLGDPAGQCTWEALALLTGLRLWAKFLRGREVRLRVRSDNCAALALATKLSSSSSTLNGLGAEIALTLEVNNLEELLTQHIPGKLNITADKLSRVWAPGGPQRIPDEFSSIRRRTVAPRDDRFFAAWRFSVTDVNPTENRGE